MWKMIGVAENSQSCQTCDPDYIADARTWSLITSALLIHKANFCTEFLYHGIWAVGSGIHVCH